MECTLIKTSRNIPYPAAVTKAIISKAKRSKYFFELPMLQLIANAKIPIKSRL